MYSNLPCLLVFHLHQTETDLTDIDKKLLDGREDWDEFDIDISTLVRKKIESELDGSEKRTEHSLANVHS